MAPLHLTHAKSIQVDKTVKPLEKGIGKLSVKETDFSLPVTYGIYFPIHHHHLFFKTFKKLL